MIKVSNLTKKYKSKVAIDNVSFVIEKGKITGFVGPNGSGKTTTIKCILGLIKPTSGTVRIRGEEYSNLKKPSNIIGNVLDSSRLHPGRTGYSTLKIIADIIGCSDECIKNVLKECGLTMEEAKRRVKTYSLGMRQRLCIAQALLSNPQILILDEPMNGLDPQGILWMRKFLKTFADKGGTVFVSSHLLSEIQKISDHIIVISHGKVIADGEIEKVLGENDDLETVFMNYTEGNDKKK